MHDEREVLEELGCGIGAFENTNIAHIKGLEPVHEPELDHEEAVDLRFDFEVELLLSLGTETVHGSHLGEL